MRPVDEGLAVVSSESLLPLLSLNMLFIFDLSATAVSLALALLDALEPAALFVAALADTRDE